MGVGLRPTGKPVDKPPDPTAARAVFLPDRQADPGTGRDMGMRADPHRIAALPKPHGSAALLVRGSDALIS